MKYAAIALLISATQAIQYVPYQYKPKTYGTNYMWEVVHRDTKDAYDFATDNVEKAMKVNPSSGSWPIAVEQPMAKSNGMDNDARRLAA